MKADEFIKAVMHEAGLPKRVDAENAVRSTLETLSEHLAGGEPGNLAAQLPHEIAIFLNQPFLGHAERFRLPTFFQRVAEREGVSYEQAERDARAVIQVLSASVTLGLVEHVKSQLPCDIADLFNVQNAEGSQTFEPYMQSDMQTGANQAGASQ